MSTVAQMLEDLILRVVKSRLPAAWQPHDVITVTSVGNGTVQGKKVGDPNPNNYPYPHEIAFTYDTPPRVGDRVIVRQSNQGTPHVSGILSTDVATSPRFLVSSSNPGMSWYIGGYVNLRTQYGADPAGAADSLAAWNACLAAIPSNGVTVIWLDPGVYTFSDVLTIPQNVLFLGAGRQVCTIRVQTTVNPCVTISNDNSGIGGMTLYNNASGGAHPATVHVAATPLSFGLRDVGFDGVSTTLGTGLEMATGSSQFGVLEGLYFITSAALSAQLAGTVYAQNCDFFGSGVGGISITGASAARFVNCRRMAASGYAVTIQSSSTKVALSDCDIPGNLVVDNSSGNTLLDTTIAGNLTEQNGATNNRYYDSPVTGSTTLLGGSRRRGASGSASDPALSIDVPSGFTPDLINAKSGTFRVLPSGDVTHGFTPVTQARAVSAAALTAGTTYTYSITGSYGVPSGARAVYAFFQTQTGTAGNGIVVGASGALPSTAGAYQTSTLSGIYMLIPLSGGGQIDVKPVTTGVTIYIDVFGYVA